MNGLLVALVTATAVWTAVDGVNVEDGEVVPVSLGGRVSRPATGRLEVVTMPYVEKIVVERTGASASGFVREVNFSPKEYNADPEKYAAEFAQRYPRVRFWVQKARMHVLFESLPHGEYRVFAKRRGGMERVKYNVKVPSTSPVYIWLDPWTGT